MKYLILVQMLICFASCGRNLHEARRVSKNFTRKYTGIDTLIRIDGYYYREDSTNISGTFIISNDRKIEFFRGKHNNHIEIQEYFNANKPRNGTYTLSGDTINAWWALRYDLGCYEIYSEKYLIVNDTTLNMIWFLCETCEPPDGKKRNPIKNEIYKFYKYPVDAE